MLQIIWRDHQTNELVLEEAGLEKTTCEESHSAEVSGFSISDTQWREVRTSYCVHIRRSSGRRTIPISATDVMDPQHAGVDWQDVYMELKALTQDRITRKNHRIFQHQLSNFWRENDTSSVCLQSCLWKNFMRQNRRRLKLESCCCQGLEVCGKDKDWKSLNPIQSCISSKS